MWPINKLLDRLSIQHLWVLTVMVAIFAFVNTHPIRPQDFWWHMAIGRDILEQGEIPAVDIYSYTRMGEPYPSYDQFWSMDILLYLVYRLGGPVLIVLFQTLVVTLAYSILLWIGWRITQNWRAAAFGVLFAAAMGFGNWNVRPQTITYLYGSLFLLGIYQYRKTRHFAWLVLFPLVMIAWVNSHGSFPIGLVLIGCWLADEIWNILLERVRRRGALEYRRLWPATFSLVVTAIACLVNPRGLGFLNYLSIMASNTVVQNFTSEWQPPNFSTLEGSIFLLGLLLSAVLLAISPRRPSFIQVISFLIFGVLGLKYTRSDVWYGIVMAPVVTEHLAATLEKAGLSSTTSTVTNRERQLNVIFLILLLFLAVISLPWFKKYLPFTPRKMGLISVETPIKATQYMINFQLKPQVFHAMDFGSYLMWEAHSQYKVFVDSRIELYPQDVWDEYFQLSEGYVNWESVIEKYGINTLMLEPERQAGLIQAALASSKWQKVYEDDYTVLFTRKLQP